LPEQKKPRLGGDYVKSKGTKGLLIARRYEEAMQGPHPKPGQVKLDGVRELQEKCTWFEKDLLACGRTKEAEREALQLTGMHLKRLEKEDPDNYAWKPERFEPIPKPFWMQPWWKL
jgi:hypothetical protein